MWRDDDADGGASATQTCRWCNADTQLPAPPGPVQLHCSQLRVPTPVLQTSESAMNGTPPAGPVALLGVRTPNAAPLRGPFAALCSHLHSAARSPLPYPFFIVVYNTGPTSMAVCRALRLASPPAFHRLTVLPALDSPIPIDMTILGWDVPSWRVWRRWRRTPKVGVSIALEVDTWYLPGYRPEDRRD